MIGCPNCGGPREEPKRMISQYIPPGYRRSVDKKLTSIHYEVECAEPFHDPSARERWWVKRDYSPEVYPDGLVGHVRDDGVVPPEGVGTPWIEVVPTDSPFAQPRISEGYPLAALEQAAIDRILASEERVLRLRGEVSERLREAEAENARLRAERDVLTLGYEGARKVSAQDAEKLAAAEGKLADMTADRDAWVERAGKLRDPDESLRKALVVVGDINHAHRQSLADAEVVIHVPLDGGAYIWKHRAGFAGFELRTLVA